MFEDKPLLTVDVESANDTTDAFVYDVGADLSLNGKTLEKKSYVIRDVFVYERELVKQAYYAEKIPLYIQDIQNHSRQMIDFLPMRKEILTMMKDYNCNTVCAYNCSFDRNALNTTLRYLTKSKQRWFFPYETDFICIWNMACQSICQLKEYKQFAEINNLISNNGKNYRATAETVYAFLTNNPSFAESHTGLQDVEIEKQIFTKCLQLDCDFPNGIGIKRNCWQNVKREVNFALNFWPARDLT